MTPPKTENNDSDRTFLESQVLSILQLSTFGDTPIYLKSREGKTGKTETSNVTSEHKDATHPTKQQDLSKPGLCGAHTAVFPAPYSKTYWVHPPSWPQAQALKPSVGPPTPFKLDVQVAIYKHVPPRLPGLRSLLRPRS